jgi:predicted glycogen debranching enzyme
LPPETEWLEADGLGGFASGTVGGLRTRRYHALLLTASTPPTGRMVLVNGLDATVRTAAGAFPLTAQRYLPDVVSPPLDEVAGRVEAFQANPWPRWSFRLEDGVRLEHEIFVPRGVPAVALAWRLKTLEPVAAELTVRLFHSGRGYHGLQRENPLFRFDPDRRGPVRIWRPYPGVPAVAVVTTGSYQHDPAWYRDFLYTAERERGLDCVEDLASPGLYHFDLARGEAVLLLAAEGAELPGGSATACLGIFRGREERRRRAFASPLHRAADSYLVRRGDGSTLVAGYPWFTDWGRDTFIALRGLCLASGRLDAARAILLAWAEHVSAGMLPNCFPDAGEAPEYNAVDASLWFVVAVHELLAKQPIGGEEGATLRAAVTAVLTSYRDGTRYGIRADPDGLLRAGELGTQLTWMDARVDGIPVTPRRGKPVEVQALWINALTMAGTWQREWQELAARAEVSFRERFFDPSRGFLYDVVDVDQVPGKVDSSFRPNQILAVGGLPRMLLAPADAGRVVAAVEERLWTPYGLRSLAPGEPGYAPHYGGSPRDRDGAYHQGTVWPWLAGPFVEAWVRVRGNTAEARQTARERFLAPLLGHLDEYGMGHLPEIADGDPPHRPCGCPFQAWSMGELLRLHLEVLSGGGEERSAARLVGDPPLDARREDLNPGRDDARVGMRETP